MVRPWSVHGPSMKSTQRYQLLLASRDKSVGRDLLVCICISLQTRVSDLKWGKSAIIIAFSCVGHTCSAWPRIQSRDLLSFLTD